jgi:hypothetical protein
MLALIEAQNSEGGNSTDVTGVKQSQTVSEGIKRQKVEKA